ncbi:MAG: Rad52/Rad22 family DNA repair protein [Blastocatellales bacterium]
MNANSNQHASIKLAPAAQTSVTPAHQQSGAEIGFSALLKRLSEGIRKGDVKQREGWRDRNGQTHYVDYVEWHVVADLLDRIVPDWSHAVRNIVQIGDFVAVTAAITINGVTREGVGTGPADSETGIKKAEHDALKRAAVKFGVARDLYRDEDGSNDSASRSGNRAPTAPPRDPLAKTLADLISPKQLALINRLAKTLKLDPEAACREMYQANLSEISRRAASALIERLNVALQEQ